MRERTECLLEVGIDRVGGDITGAAPVRAIVDLEGTSNVEHGVGTAR
jgi:hypothetical protein